MIADALPSARMEILKGFRHGDQSINHARMYADMLLELTGR